MELERQGFWAKIFTVTGTVLLMIVGTPFATMLGVASFTTTLEFRLMPAEHSQNSGYKLVSY